MIILENLSDLPSDIKFKAKTSDKPDESADYCYYHKSLKFYTCFFNNNVVKLKRKRKSRAGVVE
jgi:hypothetical protein